MNILRPRSIYSRGLYNDLTIFIFFRGNRDCKLFQLAGTVVSGCV